MPRRRYSKLTQINRDNVKNLRMVWATGARRHAGHRPERAGERGQSADRQRLHVHDRRLGHGLQDRRAQSQQGRVRLDQRFRRAARRQRAAHARHRAVGGQGDRQSPGRPRHRHQSRQRRDRLGQEGRRSPTSSAARRSSSPRRSSPKARCIVANGAGDGATRGWLAALDVKTGNELWRWYVVPKPGDPGSETWKDKNNAWKTGGGGLWQTGSYDPATQLTIWGTGNPVPQIRSAGAARATTSTPTRRSRSTSIPASWSGISSTRPTTPGTTTRSASTCSTTPPSTARTARWSAISAATDSSTTLDRANGSFIKGGQYVNDLNWTKGLDPKTGKPVEYDPKLDVQEYVPEARRCAATA